MTNREKHIDKASNKEIADLITSFVGAICNKDDCPARKLCRKRNKESCEEIIEKWLGEECDDK